MKRLLTALLLMILVAIPLQAEKYALLVGINGYQNNISPLRFCLSDVKALRQVLIDPQIGAFKADNVWLMTDDSKGIDRPTDLNIVAKLESLSRRIQTGDTFIFVFAGHGINREQKSFLLAINSDSRSMRTLEKSAVPLEMVSEILSEIRASQTLTIIDACRNDPSSGRGDQENALTSQFARGMRVVKTGATSAQPSVTATLYACSIGERAYEWAEKKHGVFSYYLMEGLRGGARNAKGEVTAVDLAGYTQEKVSQWSESQYGNQQTPWLDQSGGAKLVLVEALSQSEIYRLDISSDPAGFDIWINDQSIGSQTPKLISRPSGTYRILLKKRGYQDFRRTVTVSSEQAIVSIVARPIQIRTDIELGRGMLFVKVFDETERETSAEISLNGKLVGQAPYTDASIPEGNHQVVISKDLYHQYVEDLTVTKDQKSSLTVILKPAFGGLRINTDPPAASISLRDEDGVRVGSGTTPYHQPKLGSGRYRLDLSKNRYYSQNNRSIEINDGKTTSQSFELIPKFGTLVINSQPRGAKVLIAGQDRGQTPLKLEEMDSAQYLIEVEQALYLTYSQTVEVRDGETTELEADLVSNFGTLDLSQVSPVGARISIGGKSYGRSPTKVDLEPGSYDIQLSKKGYESQEIGGVLVVRGQTVSC
jgi:hypothetical protein